MDRDSLSSMKVSGLRQLCKKNGLLVSGNKEALIARILGDSEGSDMASEGSKPVSKEDRDAAIDRLLARTEGGGSTDVKTTESISQPSAEASQPQATVPELPESGLPEGWTMEQWVYYGHQWLKNQKPETKVSEAEVLEADIVEPELPQPPPPQPEENDALILDDDESLTLDEDDPWTAGVVDDEEIVLIAEDIPEEIDSDASITITLPSLSTINLETKHVAAITVVFLILAAGAFTFFFQNDPSFQARELRYGDSMQFNIEASSINIEGDDMLAIFRDAAGGTLDDACGELEIDISTGSGSIRIRKGGSAEIIHQSDSQYEGAVNALDAFGRSHLTAEKVITHSMIVDLTGKTWSASNPSDCGNTGWILEDNTVDISSHSWTDIGDRELIKTSTDITLRDSENKATNLEAVTFGLEAISGLGIAGQYIAFPMTPIDLYAFFGDQTITSSSSSEFGDTWTWSVGEEINDANHGMVYPISMSHDEFDTCNGHVLIDLLVKSGVPWPVEQSVSIVIDKSQKTSECGLIESSVSDATIPDGRVTIMYKMMASSNSNGDREIDWLADYTSKPGPGEDRPGTSSQRSWGVAMPDESEKRSWNLEEALNCLVVNQSTSGAAMSIEQGGYIWKASTKTVGSTVDWNLSWVNEDDSAGWTVIRQRDDGCTVMDDDNYDDDIVEWNRDAIPDTQTLQTLEARILASSRYPLLNTYIGDGSGNWDEDVEFGYLLTVSQDNDVFDLVPVSIGEGAVNAAAQKTWTDDNNKEHTLNMAMDAENGRMLGWFHYW